MRPGMRAILLKTLATAALFSALGAPAARAAIPAAERQALIDFYRATTGRGPWRHREGWLGPAGTECSWFGVRCDAAETTVVGLFLENNGLNGSQVIPALPNLVNLDLSDNPFVACSTILHFCPDPPVPLPAVIGTFFTRLETLDLSNANLAGPIPPDLGQLDTLLSLDLSDNALSGPIPAELGELGIHILDLSGNRLSGMPPVALADLGLAILDLSDNLLVGEIPDWIGGMATLRDLDLSANPWTHGPVPEWIRELRSLQSLGLSATGRTGEIPTWLGELTSLRILALGGNRLTGAIPAELGGLPILRVLRLEGNRLAGQVPAALAELETLLPEAGLDLRWNALSQGDAAIVGFLNSRQRDGADWRDTQTIAPRNLVATATGPRAIRLTWVPIRYREARGGDPGGYLIFVSTSPEPGTGIVAGRTASKNASSFEVTGLRPRTRYWFTVRAVTSPHVNNANQIVSPASAQVTAATPRR